MDMFQVGEALKYCTVVTLLFGQHRKLLPEPGDVTASLSPAFARNSLLRPPLQSGMFPSGFSSAQAVVGCAVV